MWKLIIFISAIVCYSATNDTTIDSATIKRIYMGNYSYNTILANAPILTMRWASDLNRPVFKNRTGTAYKMLADASTTSNTPSTRIFYADTNGAATSSSGLTFASSKLNITGKLTISDSITSGAIKSSDRITATDFEASDSVKAVNASFIGRITGTDLQASDSVIGVTGAFSGALTGTTLNTGNGANELYAMNQNVRTTDGVTFATVNTGNGANELYPMDQGTRTTDDVAFNSVIAVTGDYSGRVTGYTFDAFDSIKGTHGYFTWGISTDGDVVAGGHGTFRGELTGSSLNTGHGANELYPMDQDQRTTASPTHVLGTYTDGVRAYNATSSGSYVGLFKSPGALPGFPSSYFPVLKTDNSHLFFSTGGFYTAAMGKDVFAILDSTSSSFKFSVEKDTTTTKIIKADSIKLGTGSYLKTYVEGTMACTLKTSDVTVQQVANAYYTRIGNIVNISFPYMSGESNSTTMVLYCNFPYAPKQTYIGLNVQTSHMSVINNSIDQSAQGSFSSSSGTPKKMNIYLWNGARFTSSGTKGISPCTISYIAD